MSAALGEPRWVTEAVLLTIHAQQVERYGGAHGVRDQDVVRSALARPIHRWAHDDEADLADLAAVYLVAFVGSQGFNDGNKRTGLACALVFLRLNGYVLHVPAGELYALTMQIATGEADDGIAAGYCRSRMKPASA